MQNIFIACDTNDTKKVKKIIKETQTKKIKIGYKFGLEFLNSKNGRAFVSKMKNKIIFADLKLHDIPNTCASTIKAIKDLKINYLTVHISSGLEALKAVKTWISRRLLLNSRLLEFPGYAIHNLGLFDRQS